MLSFGRRRFKPDIISRRWVKFASNGRSSGAQASASVLLAELRAFAGRESGQAVQSRRELREALAAVEFPKDFSADCADTLLEKKVAMVAEDKFAFSCTGCGACCRSFSDTVQVDPADAAAMSLELARQAGTASGASATIPSALTLLPTSFKLETGFFSTAALPRGAQAVSLAGQPFLPPGLQRLSAVLVHVETFDVAAGGAAEASVEGQADEVEGSHTGSMTANVPRLTPFDAAGTSCDGFGDALTRAALKQVAAEDDVSGLRGLSHPVDTAASGAGDGRSFVWTRGWATASPSVSTACTTIESLARAPVCEAEPLSLNLTGGLAPIIYLQSRSNSAAKPLQADRLLPLPATALELQHEHENHSQSESVSASAESAVANPGTRLRRRRPHASLSRPSPSVSPSPTSSPSRGAQPGDQADPAATSAPTAPGVADRVVTIADDADRICPFAVPGPRHAPPPPRRGTDTGPGGSSRSSGVGNQTSAGISAGLRCSLGGAGMPYTCALYPLGDMWARQVQVQSKDKGTSKEQTQVVSARQSRLLTLQDRDHGTASASAGSMSAGEGKGKGKGTGEEKEDGEVVEEEELFYALDHRRCEGVAAVRVGEVGTGGVAAIPGVASRQENDSGKGGAAHDQAQAQAHDQAQAHEPFAAAPPPLASVAAYRAAPHRQLAQRRARAEWFRRLATTVAVLQMDQRLASAVEAAAAAAGELLYAEALLSSRKSSLVGAADTNVEAEAGSAPAAGVTSSASDVSGWADVSDLGCGPGGHDWACMSADQQLVLRRLLSDLQSRVAADAFSGGLPVAATESSGLPSPSPSPSQEAQEARAEGAEGKGKGIGIGNGEGSPLAFSADGCSAFALELLAQAWYFHQHGTQPVNVGDAKPAAGTGAGHGSSHVPASSSASSSASASDAASDVWRQWQRSVEGCTAVALAHLHAAASRLQAAAQAWEALALQKRRSAADMLMTSPVTVAAAANPSAAIEDTQGCGAQRESRPLSSGMAAKASAGGRGRKRSRGSTIQPEKDTTHLPLQARRDAATKGAAIAQRLAARLLIAPPSC